MPFTVTATVTVDIPQAEAGAFLTALIASVPADVAPTSASIVAALPSPVAGTLAVTGSVTAPMSTTDLGKFVEAVIAALPADATLQSGSLTFGVQA